MKKKKHKSHGIKYTTGLELRDFLFSSSSYLES